MTDHHRQIDHLIIQEGMCRARTERALAFLRGVDAAKRGLRAAARSLAAVFC